MAFAKEPPYTHGQPARIGVLLCNLGTPEAPTPSALRRYLGQFLSDHRVVEIPKAIWWPILHGVILRKRPKESAAKYASIWTPEGSPLKAWTEKQTKLLRGYLGERGHHVDVRYAMRYGQPSVPSQLDAMKADGCTRILVLPAYPQYCAATTASVYDMVFRWGLNTRTLPEFRFVNHYHDDAGYIDALKASVQKHWMAHGRPDKLVMSFHGMPERTLHLGDPYHCECHKTGRLLAEALGLQRDEYLVTFQSRFGRAKWLEPYTEPSLVALAGQGVGRVDVICPGFSSDCIETLEEINQEAREAFLHAGGKEFHYIPCLNDSAEGMRALTAICERHLAGWPTQQAPAADEQQRTRATAMGATV
ncbi:ferrochelatase [Tepidicella baoligensis]|uniref:ferrochelatase n=1 Tax=Tepidicella baoligensis TaxID=2707016 RepID=UPI0015DBB379|nr:ferrochelatase [Tepidicella baoligensis]